MALLPAEQTRALCPVTGESFFWRGWSDRERCVDGKTVQLRRSHDPALCIFAKPVVSICGRSTPPFKVIPRYVDLHLYRTTLGTYVCQRRWVSEARGEMPVRYDTAHESSPEALRDVLMNFDPAEHATSLWTDAAPGGRERREKAKAWFRTDYARRVESLLAACEEGGRRR